MKIAKSYNKPYQRRKTSIVQDNHAEPFCPNPRYSGLPTPCPDRVKIELMKALPLKQVRSDGLGDQNPLTHVMAHNWLNAKRMGNITIFDPLADNTLLASEIDQVKNWLHKPTGTTVHTRKEGITALTLNVPKLAFNQSHNGYHINTVEQLQQGFERLKEIVMTLTETDFPDYEFLWIEIGGVLRLNYLDIEGLIANRNFPKFRSKQQVYPGESVTYGTASGSSRQLKIYAKLIEMKKKMKTKEKVSNHKFTRFELKIRKRAHLRKYFGGVTPTEITLARMKEVFWDAVFELVDACPHTETTDLPKGIRGLMGKCIMLQDLLKQHGVEDSEYEPVENWWLRVNNNRRSSKELIRDSHALALAARGLTLEQLIRSAGDFVSLPEDVVV